jgi:hypothetical protein
MITGDNIVNRAITQTQAARLSGLPRGTVARLAHDGDYPARDEYTVADALALTLAEHFVHCGFTSAKAASIAALVSPEEWQRVVCMKGDQLFLFVFRDRLSGEYVVEVASFAAIRRLAVFSPIVVDLTAIWAKMRESDQP